MLLYTLFDHLHFEYTHTGNIFLKSLTRCKNTNIYLVVVHPKMKILSSFTHALVILDLYDFLLQNTTEDTLKNIVDWHPLTCIGFVSIQQE